MRIRRTITDIINTLMGAARALAVASLFIAYSASTTASPEPIFTIDFSDQPDGDASAWLQSNDFQFKLDAENLNPHFDNGRLVLETDDTQAGLFAKQVNIPGINSIRITWGVDRFPQGADWDQGIKRTPIAVMVSFGEDKIESGAVYLPDAPYFIGLFLGEKEQDGRAYVGRYYKQGGRYFCTPCGHHDPGDEIVTEFDLRSAVTSQFDLAEIPAVSSIGLQMNTEDTSEGARAFVAKIEFFGD